MKQFNKGSSYIGVYKCTKTKLYYCKTFHNKKCHKSNFFKNEIDAAKKYDSIKLKYNSNSKKINFPINNIKKIKKFKKKLIIRKKIYEHTKIIVYDTHIIKTITKL